MNTYTAEKEKHTEIGTNSQQRWRERGEKKDLHNMNTYFFPETDPVRWTSLLPESVKSKAPKDITEFSFSPDYKFIAIGALDG